MKIIKEITKQLVIQEIAEASRLFEKENKYIHIIGKHYEADIMARGNMIKISGDEEKVSKCIKVLSELHRMYCEYIAINEKQVRTVIELLDTNQTDLLYAMQNDIINVSKNGTMIRPRIIGQKYYVDAIRTHDITFGIGPAGCGKTYLAVALGAFYLKNHNVLRIILVRPAVEAGEKLGFLPGDLQEKVNPYLRPLFDGLSDMFGIDEFIKLQQKGMIEVAPLAYMRGRTLEKSFIILDEAQNTTKEQIKMFLTRLGNCSKMVINGDITQIDLPSHTVSGLVDAQRVLKNVKGISTIKFTSEDVVRHDLVAAIINAYEKDAKRKRKAEDRKNYGNNDQLQ